VFGYAFLSVVLPLHFPIQKAEKQHNILIKLNLKQALIVWHTNKHTSYEK